MLHDNPGLTLNGLQLLHQGGKPLSTVSDIKGQLYNLAERTKDSYGTRQKGPFTKTLWLPRTFPVEQEQVLLQFLHDKTAQVYASRLIQKK